GPAVAPSAAVVLAGPAADVPALVALLGEHLPALVDLDAARRRAAVRAGATEVDLADLVDALPGDPATTARLLDAAGTDPHVLERLATVAVPLADGRVVRGARGLLLARDVPPAVLPVLARWGVRLAHPDVVHPTLERLGAHAVGAGDLLRDPAVRERVRAEDDDAPGVLLALAAADPGHDEAEPWWGDVLLPAADGEPTPARDLVLPGSDAQRWFDPSRVWVVDTALADRSRAALERLGVRAGVVVRRTVLGPGDDDEPLDGWDEYLARVEDLAGVEAEALDAEPVPVVADLELVRPEAWAEVLGVLARGDARAALVTRVRAHAAGRAVELPGYAAWWLRERSGLGLPTVFALPGVSPAVRDLLEPVPRVLADLDEQVLRVLGGARELADLDLDTWHAVLGDLADRRPGARLDGTVAVAVWRALRADPGAAPDVVPALTHDGVRAVPLDDVAVADPMWAQLAAVRPCLVVPTRAVEELADALDVEPAPARSAGRVTSRGEPAVVPADVARTWPAVPGTYREHDRLEVDGDEVAWWVQDGVPHAATGRGLAAALASLVGWDGRDALARVLAGEAADDVVLEQAGEAQRD
ncbi:ATP-binding protein, partial [Cellulomonas sp. APG4]|nr:ATP-binding protein [Cellulomonas sp. APG4]